MIYAVSTLLLAAAKAKTSSASYIIFIYIALFGAFYFFYLRPRSKKTRAQRATNSMVEVGDRAQTIGGIVGEVTKIDGDTITLRSSSGHEMDFVRRAIAQKLPAPFDDVISDDPNAGSEDTEQEEGH